MLGCSLVMRYTPCIPISRVASLARGGSHRCHVSRIVLRHEVNIQTNPAHEKKRSVKIVGPTNHASLRPEPTRAIERSHVVLFKQPRVKLSSTCIIGLRVGELEIFESELSLLTVKNSPLVC